MQDKLRYTATLSGAEIDLNLLAHCFTTDECRVTLGEWSDVGRGKFYMLSGTMLDLVPDIEKKLVNSVHQRQIEVHLDRTWDRAEAIAKRLLDSMNGAARLIEHQYKPVEVGSMHKFSLDGQYMGGSARSRGGDWRNYSMPSEKRGLAELVRLWALKGFEEEAVSVALAMYGSMPRTWTMLFMVFEIVQGDLKGDLSRFITDNMLSEFTKAANNARDLQQGPRHAKPTPVKQHDLIDLNEGDRIIRHLLNHWLADKVGKYLSHEK